MVFGRVKTQMNLRCFELFGQPGILPSGEGVIIRMKIITAQNENITLRNILIRSGLVTAEQLRGV